MATFNHKIEVVNGNTIDTFHPETNSNQVYDFTNSAWLSSIIGTLSSLTTTQKTSLVASINEIAGTKANTTALNAHTSSIATTSQLGHVMPDGTTIIIDGNGKISATGGVVPAQHTHSTSEITDLDTILSTKYVKPANGIPSTDLTSSVQNSLAKAESALQSVSDASTTVKGIVQLNNTLTSTSTTQAITAAQAKVVNDALASHTGNSDIHVTATNKTDWNAKETTTGSQQKVNTHAAIVATTSQLGHVRPDGTTITIDNNGVISSVGVGGTPDAHTHTTAQITGLDSALASKANLASPTFTGTPNAPTASVSTNTTQIATTAFVQSRLLATLDSAAFTGIITAPTAPVGTNTTQIATTAFVTTAITNKTSITGNAGSATKLATARTINGVSFDGTANITIFDSTKAPLVSPALTGTPTAPTATSTTNTTQIATTAFVQSNVSTHLNDYMPHESSLSQTASSMDSNGIYTIVEFKRANNTLYMRSTASNPNSNGHYQTITWQFYATNGTTLSLTKTWTITYNNNGLAISKVVV